MAITTRTELKNYCLRSLGEPVLKINVADEQVEDRIDDAIQYYQEYHELGTEKMYHIYTITQNDIDNQYIDVDDIDSDIYAITRLIKVNDAYDVNFMNSAYQYKLSLHKDLLYSGRTDDYYIAMQHLDIIERTFESGEVIDFNKNANKLRIITNWEENFTADESKIAIESHDILDPQQNTKFYNDPELKQLCTQMIKRQWGENLKKMKGIQLAGGVELDGQSIYDEADAALKELKEKIEDRPMGFYIG